MEQDGGAHRRHGARWREVLTVPQTRISNRGETCSARVTGRGRCRWLEAGAGRLSTCGSSARLCRIRSASRRRRGKYCHKRAPRRPAWSALLGAAAVAAWVWLATQARCLGTGPPDLPGPRPVVAGPLHRAVRCDCAAPRTSTSKVVEETPIGTAPRGVPRLTVGRPHTDRISERQTTRKSGSCLCAGMLHESAVVQRMTVVQRTTLWPRPLPAVPAKLLSYSALYREWACPQR